MDTNDELSLVVAEFPNCNIAGCKDKARYNGKTKEGRWELMCEKHFEKLGVGLGLGKGLKFALQDDGEGKKSRK